MKSPRPASAALRALATALAAALVLAPALPAFAAPVAYDIDPSHTYPSFEADHMGMSYWRGKLNKNAGSIRYDKATGAGSVEVTMDLSSIDFGLPAMNSWATGKDFFNLAEKGKDPNATFKGRFEGGGKDKAPIQVLGELSLNGQTRPMTLTIHQLKCMPHPMLKRDFCGADASGSFNRDEFGLSAGKDWGFKMEVKLRIQVEAVARE